MSKQKSATVATGKAKSGCASVNGSALTEKFKFTPAEEEHMRRLLEWQEQSARSTMVFGPSIECPNCHVMNNPNNPHCHQCHERL